ncbi:MAG: GFA family protein [Hyphomicrobiaceae bacterium]
MSGPRDVSGRCLCGAVTFTARTAGSDVGACHCTMCQRWAAGPLLAAEIDASSLRVADDASLGVYQSSEWGERLFCKSCGTPLFWRSRDGQHAIVSAGALDDKSGLRFASQIYIDEKPSYYEFANDTAKMTGAEFIAMMTAAKKD